MFARRRGIVPNQEIIMQSLKTVLAPLAITMAVTGTAASEPLLIRNSYVVPIDWQPLLVAKKDLANHWGKSYTMEAVRYHGTPPMITALANDELEIAALAYSTLGVAVENAGISDLRVISDQFRDGVSGYSPTSSSSARTQASRRSRTSRARCSPPTQSAPASTSP
jgi:hypothetical protein